MVRNVALVVTFNAIAPNDSCRGLSTVYDVFEFGSRFAWKLSEPLRTQNYLTPTWRTAKPYTYLNAHVCGKQRTAKTSFDKCDYMFSSPQSSSSISATHMDRRYSYNLSNWKLDARKVAILAFTSRDTFEVLDVAELNCS